MADEERKELPVLDMKVATEIDGAPVKVKLEMSRPMKTGTNNWGTWNLWLLNVENTDVVWGRKKEEKRIEKGYTGKALMFPSKKLHEDFVSMAGGNNGVEISIIKKAKDGPKGPIYVYPAEKLSEGDTPQNSLAPTEVIFLKDIASLKSKGMEVPEDVFVQASQDESYEGKISEDRAKELFSLAK